MGKLRALGPAFSEAGGMQEPLLPERGFPIYTAITLGLSLLVPHRITGRKLRREGLKVIRIWQHSLKKHHNACLTRIRRALTN